MSDGLGPGIRFCRRPGLFPARLVDRAGRVVGQTWVPSGARVVMVLGRVFLHHVESTWREAPVFVTDLAQAPDGAW